MSIFKIALLLVLTSQCCEVEAFPFRRRHRCRNVSCCIKEIPVHIGLDVDNNGRLGDAADGREHYLPGEISRKSVLYFDGKYSPQPLNWVVQGLGHGMGIDQVRFRIVESTCHPGFCGNGTDPMIEGSGRDDDYSFSKSQDQRVAYGTLLADRTIVQIWCKDSGGKC